MQPYIKTEHRLPCDCANIAAALIPSLIHSQSMENSPSAPVLLPISHEKLISRRDSQILLIRPSRLPSSVLRTRRPFNKGQYAPGKRGSWLPRTGLRARLRGGAARSASIVRDTFSGDKTPEHVGRASFDPRARKSAIVPGIGAD